MNSPLKVSLENIIPLTEARDHFSQIVTEVQNDKLYVLTKGGKPAVAIIDVKYLESISGGSVKPEHIETEIQKDPAKVGRTTMIKHETPAKPPLEFPQAEPPKPEPIKSSEPAPIKINFQPASTSATATPPSMPIAPPPPAVTPPMTPTPPIVPTPPPPITPPPVTPNPTFSSTPPPLAAPPVAPANPANIGGMIDMIPSSEDTTPAPSRVAPEDQVGPAQYAGENPDEPKDMEI